MHLFALLIAAVFSSEFVTPNTFASFTATLKAVTTTELEGTVPTFKVTLDVAPAELPTGFITLVATGYTTAKVDFAALTQDEGKTYIVPATDISSLSAAVATQASIFIHLKDTGMTDAVYIEVPVANTWSIALTTPGTFYDTSLTSTPAFTITADHKLGWDAEKTAEVRWTFDEEKAPRTAELTLVGSAATSFTIAAGGTLAALGILTADVKAGPITLDVYIKLAGGKYYAEKATLEVTYNLPAFTTAASVTEVELVATKAFTFSPTVSDAWDGKAITAVFSKAKTQPADAVAGKAFPVTKPDVAWGCTADLRDWDISQSATEFYVYIYVDDTPVRASNSPAFLLAPATVGFVKEGPITGVIGLTPDAVAWTAREDTGAIAVAITGATALTASAKYKIVYTDAEEVPHEKTGALSNNAGAYSIPTLNLGDWDLPNAAANLKVSIYPTGTRNAYPLAADFNITKSLAEFSVTPNPVTSLTTIAKLKVTATDGASWSNDGIAVRLEFPGKDPINLELALETTRANAAKVFFKDNVDISDFEAATGATITVKAAKAKPAGGAQPDFLDVPVDITITVPEEEFTIAPDSMVWAADLKNPVDIVIEPVPATVWSAPVATFTYTPTPARSNDPAPVVVTLTKNAAQKWIVAAETNLNALAIPEPAEDEEIEVVVTINTGAKVLEHEETFKITKTAPGPGPADVTFTLDPASTKWVEELKTIKTEVKPSTGAVWPDAAHDELKATFKLTDKTDVSVKLVVEGTTTKKYYIPAGTDLTGFGITEENCPKALTVHIKDGAVDLTATQTFTITKPGADAAMGVSPLLSLLAALVFLFVKLF